MRIEVLQKRLNEYEPTERKSISSGFDNSEILKVKKNDGDSDIVGSLNLNVDVGLLEEEI